MLLFLYVNIEKETFLKFFLLSCAYKINHINNFNFNRASIKIKISNDTIRK